MDKTHNLTCMGTVGPSEAEETLCGTTDRPRYGMLLRFRKVAETKQPILLSKKKEVKATNSSRFLLPEDLGNLECSANEEAVELLDDILRLSGDPMFERIVSVNLDKNSVAMKIIHQTYMRRVIFSGKLDMKLKMPRGKRLPVYVALRAVRRLNSQS